MRKRPNDSSNHTVIGSAFLLQKRYDEARDAALSALALNPNNKHAQQLLVMSKLRQNRWSGWMHALGFKLMRMSNAKQLMAVFGVLFAAMSGRHIATYTDFPAARIWMDAVLYGGIALDFLSSFHLNSILRKETRNVRVKRDY